MLNFTVGAGKELLSSVFTALLQPELSQLSQNERRFGLNKKIICSYFSSILVSLSRILIKRDFTYIVTSPGMILSSLKAIIELSFAREKGQYYRILRRTALRPLNNGALEMHLLIAVTWCNLICILRIKIPL